eukprot:7262198-Prymnesium_polylepis.1
MGFGAATRGSALAFDASGLLAAARRVLGARGAAHRERRCRCRGRQSPSTVGSCSRRAYEARDTRGR